MRDPVDTDALAVKWLPEVERQMHEYVASSVVADSSLAKMYRWHLDAGGKRFRALVGVSISASLGDDVARAVPFVAACEMLHNASLVLDDLQDGDEVRRGREAVWRRYGAAHAVNLVVAMLYWAIGLVDGCDAPTEVRDRVRALVLQRVVELTEGQERDLRLRDETNPSLADYLHAAEAKTATLLRLVVTGAAILAGADEEVITSLDRIARHMGLLFQLQDDVLDLYGDKGRDRPGRDLQEGKRSLLVVHCLEVAAHDDRKWLLQLLGRDQVSDDEIQRAMTLFEQSGSTEFVKSRIDHHRDAARMDPLINDHPVLGPLFFDLIKRSLAPIARVLA